MDCTLRYYKKVAKARRNYQKTVFDQYHLPSHLFREIVSRICHHSRRVYLPMLKGKRRDDA
eukprot:scaffold9016_cov61-Skeletonema_dohrnii-CCMP3373.AAC.1